MKKIILIATMIAGLKGFSQSIAINTTGNAANGSAMLDVSSSNKGFLTPRMTTTQRTAIVSPAEGLLVYDTDTKSFWYFSTSWKEINLNGGGGFTLPYNGTWNTNLNVFSINNASVNGGSTGILGRSGPGASSFDNSLNSVGVWGDNTFTGLGVLGTSVSGTGVFGYSAAGNGVFGRGSGNNNAGIYGISNDSSGIGVMGYLQNGGTAVWGVNWGLGHAAKFESNNSLNTDASVEIVNSGSGRSLEVVQGINGTADAALFSNDGLARSVTIQATNANNTNQVLRVANTSKGTGLYVENFNSSTPNYVFEGWQSGIGGGMFMQITNPNSNGAGLSVYHKGTGKGVIGISEKGVGGSFGTSNATNSSVALEAFTSGTGIAGKFNINNTSNANAVLSASTSGSGPGLLVDNTHGALVFSLATFRSSGINKARIDGSGKGFFNGGTQSSGADVAEVFDVIGTINEYETGDVLVISTDQDRTVEKSAGAYSTLVAGVYATKPGVVLTEENIDADISGKVPMGVVGVIPTKVCLEGGEIKRGDLLVTSSIPGVAMKADLSKVKPGQVIGKALENYNSSSTGKIKVLVSVK